MGERLNDGAGLGRRRARPDDALAAPPGLEEMLARALRAPAGRPHEGDGSSRTGEACEGEQRAVAAFRAARAAGDGGRPVRARRRDDWRPRARRRTARSLRVTLCALVAGLALGGAAFAAIDSGTDRAEGAGVGVGDGSGGGGAGRARPSAGAAVAPSGAPSAVPSATRDADREGPAERGSAADEAALCHAWGTARGHGGELAPAARQRLVTAAGGEKNVEAYCAAAGRRTGAANGTAGGARENGRTGASGGGEGSGGAGESGASGRPGTSGRTGTGGAPAGSGKDARPQGDPSQDGSGTGGDSPTAKAKDTGAGDGA
ncbi:hypothetical protein [Streptomyces hilarionis]|uniref:hypothetical protein n=1 Tax=Streptomyces hilarionis TaxID=2839954 RepID=UPI00211A3DEF|nr:hypothetical protein [Streptomyces hilarionis]MCQ9132731.1 hypothetical protein [Streptomyces hilarionis]